jgi:hypothetical protein
MTKEETIAFVTDLFNREADKIDEMYKQQQRNGNNKEW